MSNDGKYLRLAPGQVCMRCGADSSFRTKGTKWCYDCSKAMANIRKHKEKAYVDTLKRRDDVNNGPHSCCSGHILRERMFCPTCGQRLQRGDLNGSTTITDTVNEYRGLYGKYIINKSDGSPIDKEAKYFVLRLDTDEAARIALQEYARHIKLANSVLYKDLMRMLRELSTSHEGGKF